MENCSVPCNQIEGAYRRQSYVKYIESMVLAIGDYAAIVLALLLACFLRAVFFARLFPEWPLFTYSPVYIFGIIPTIYLAFLAYDGHYARRRPLWQGVERLFRVCTYVSILVIVLLYFLGKADQVSRLVVGMGWLFSFVTISTFRVALKRMMVHCGILQTPVVLIGAGKTAELLYQAFLREQNLGYRIVGVIEDYRDHRPLAQQLPYWGTFQEAEELVKSSGVQDVILAIPGMQRERMLELLYKLQPHVRNLTLVPDLFGVPMANLSVETLFNEKTVLLHVHNNLLKRRNRMFKRLFDILACVLGSCFFAPLLGVLAVLVKLSSPGEVVFAHQRVGEKGKFFPCYKFRTMVTNGDEVLRKYFIQHPEAKVEWERDFKLKDDPRITKIGEWLRKTSLDELPQLFNVLRGEMSLVGPRPIVQAEVARYAEYISDYYVVKPGITGWWQVCGRSDVGYPERVQMDSWYVRNWSVWLDLVILAKTFNVVLGKKGAY